MKKQGVAFAASKIPISKSSKQREMNLNIKKVLKYAGFWVKYCSIQKGNWIIQLRVQRSVGWDQSLLGKDLSIMAVTLEVDLKC